MVKAWDYTLVGDIFEFKNGLNKGKEFFGYGTPIVNYTDVYKKRALTKTDINGKVSLEADEIKRFEARRNDVFFTRTSETPEEVGMSSVLLEDIEGCVFSGFVLRARPKNNMLNPQYCKYCFSTPEIRSAIILGCTYTTRALTNGKQLSAISMPIPPLEEQKRIAEALSDADSMISSLEKLIAKKKAVKQGAMQELLTGKKRLPGFAGEWAHMELGKYGSLMKETINPQLSSSEYFWEYSMPAFDEGRTPIKQKGADMHSNRTVICGKVLLFNKLNVRQKRIWLIDQCRDSAVCSSEFLPYKSDVINLELLSQILYTDKVTLEFIGMSTGTSNSQKRITPDAFLEYKVYLPVNEKEQAVIANVFSCMDNEIEALEQKLEKTRQIKQGMMQQLLTGKIRIN